MTSCEGFRLQWPAWEAGRLPAGEARLLEAHLEGCETCLRLLESSLPEDGWLGRLPPPMSPGFLERVSSGAEASAVPRRNGPRLAWGAAAALLLAWAGLRMWPDGSVRVLRSASSAALRRDPVSPWTALRAGQVLDEGSILRSGTSGGLLLGAPGGLRIGLEPASEVRLLSLREDRGIGLALDAGGISCNTGRLPDTELTVETPEGRVRARGAEFRVAVIQEAEDPMKQTTAYGGGAVILAAVAGTAYFVRHDGTETEVRSPASAEVVRGEAPRIVDPEAYARLVRELEEAKASGRAMEARLAALEGEQARPRKEGGGEETLLAQAGLDREGFTALMKDLKETRERERLGMQVRSLANRVHVIGQDLSEQEIEAIGLNPSEVAQVNAALKEEKRQVAAGFKELLARLDPAVSPQPEDPEALFGTVTKAIPDGDRDMKTFMKILDLPKEDRMALLRGEREVGSFFPGESSTFLELYRVGYRARQAARQTLGSQLGQEPFNRLAEDYLRLDSYRWGPRIRSDFSSLKEWEEEAREKAKKAR